MRDEKVDIDFIIWWAPRSGTTSLYKHLCLSQEVFMWWKESWFFFLYGYSHSSLWEESSEEEKNIYKFLFEFSKNGDPMGNSTVYNKNIHVNSYIYESEAYAQHYSPAWQEKKRWDCSPIYLSMHKVCIPAIFDVVNNPSKVKFVFILRNPIDSCKSFFTMFSIGWLEKRNFSECIDEELQNSKSHWFPYLSTYRYYEPLKQYLQKFGDENLKIVLFDDLINNNMKVLDEIYRFIWIKPLWFPMNHENNTKTDFFFLNQRLQDLVEKKWVPDKLRVLIESKNKYDIKGINNRIDISDTVLKEFFRNDIKNLYKIFPDKRILSWIQ